MFTDWSHLTQGCLFTAVRPSAVNRAFHSQALPVCSPPLTGSASWSFCFSLPLSFFLFFMNERGSWEESKDLSYGSGDPWLPTIRTRMHHINHRLRGALCSPSVFPPGHSRLYFSGTLAVTWNHLTVFWPMEHGSIISPMAGRRAWWTPTPWRRVRL